MTTLARSLIAAVTLVLLAGCAGPARDCPAPAMPPPPPPPPCCCGQDGRGPGGGPGGMAHRHHPGAFFDSSSGDSDMGPGGHHDGRPGEPGGFGRGFAGNPPPAALAACEGKKAGEACKIDLRGWELVGQCREPRRPPPGEHGARSEDRKEEPKDAPLACSPTEPKAPPGADGPKPPTQDAKPKK
ncbi:MAG: hypothetical protein QM784_21120 [Polyangiaceae bacterium]